MKISSTITKAVDDVYVVVRVRAIFIVPIVISSVETDHVPRALNPDRAISSSDGVRRRWIVQRVSDCFEFLRGILKPGFSSTMFIGTRGTGST